jgi:phenylalanyl-tRNA synthetase beta chain
MKFSEKWLREWVNPEISRQALVDQLTMTGLEVDGVEPVANDFSDVIIGEVLTVENSGDNGAAQCTVDIGRDKSVTLASKAANLRAGLRVAVNGEQLYSEAELGIGDNAQDAYVLPQDAPVGTDCRQYLYLDDCSIDIDLTPNRGDCLSIAGIAREVSVLNREPLNELDVTPQAVSATHEKADLNVTLSAPEGCPHYVGRSIYGVNPQAATPLWMQEKLRRGGIRSIDPIVDITNYVMLELGQPMHAFDLSTIEGGIDVRFAKAGETIDLLDGQTKTLSDHDLVIADHQKAIAMAGVMGGDATAVKPTTRDIFLESAHFAPPIIFSRARKHGLNSDSSYRFARGVDPELQVRAIERATELILEYVGGQAGALVEVRDETHCPKPKVVPLRSARLERVLGFPVSDEVIVDVLERLGFGVFLQGDRFEVHVPARRFDIEIEVDLIEEIIRIHGYDKIPDKAAMAALQMLPIEQTALDERQAADHLVARGYQEAIVYSFVDPQLQSLLFPDSEALPLANPISQDLSVMRMSLWPGLIQTLRHNQHRQQNRVRLFESGLCFINQEDGLLQERRISGLASGSAYPEQWAMAQTQSLDYYDIKADVESLLALKPGAERIQYQAVEHAALHPGQAAQIVKDGVVLGWVGALHPRIQQHLELAEPVYLFELRFDALQQNQLPQYQPISKFPAIRRDLSFTVNVEVSAQAIEAQVRQIAGDWLQDVHLFDVYQGEGVNPGEKSVALAMLLQHPDRTLTDPEIAEVVEHVLQTLTTTFAISLRK